MKILGTGLSGLVGSRVVELLSPRHTFVNFSLENGVDITNRDDITSRIVQDTESPWVVHLAAFTNVQQAEKDRELGDTSAAWKVNVEATQYIIDACKASQKRLLYVDTDYAFDGKKKEYSEDDEPNPLSWYAVTKSEGAKRVLSYDKGLVIRISNPYRANPVGLPAGSPRFGEAGRQGKTDFVHKMLERLRAGQEIIAPDDQLFVPTFIDDIAATLDKLTSLNGSGIYHVVGSQPVSPYEAAIIIAKAYGLSESLVKPTTFAQYFAGRAPIPQYAVLSNDKARALGVTLRGFSEGVAEVVRQETTEPK